MSNFESILESRALIALAKSLSSLVWNVTLYIYATADARPRGSTTVCQTLSLGVKGADCPIEVAFDFGLEGEFTLLVPGMLYVKSGGCTTQYSPSNSTLLTFGRLACPN